MLAQIPDTVSVVPAGHPPIIIGRSIAIDTGMVQGVSVRISYMFTSDDERTDYLESVKTGELVRAVVVYAPMNVWYSAFNGLPLDVPERIISGKNVSDYTTSA